MFFEAVADVQYTPKRGDVDPATDPSHSLRDSNLAHKGAAVRRSGSVLKLRQRSRCAPVM